MAMLRYISAATVAVKTVRVKRGGRRRGAGAVRAEGLEGRMLLAVDLMGWNCYAPNTAAWGQQFTMNYQIRNAGSTPVTTDFQVQFVLSSDTVFGDADDIVVQTETHTADINGPGYGPSLTSAVVLPKLIPAGYPASGTVYIGMRTDSSNLVSESNEANNFATVGQYSDWDSLPVGREFDLTGWDCYAPASAAWGRSIMVQSQIRNTGATTVTADFTVEYYLSSDATFGDADDLLLGSYLHTADVPGSDLGPDFTLQLSLPSTIPSRYPASGTFYIGMKTDTNNLVAETSEINNFASIGDGYDRATLSIHPAYDLSGALCNVTTGSALWGQSISVQGQIHNGGSTTLQSPFTVAYYLSDDASFGDADDLLLGTHNHTGTVPFEGDAFAYSTTLTLPSAIPAGYAPAGTFFIGMKTDSGNAITEANETNNFGTVGLGLDYDTLTVAPSWDLTVTSLSVSPSVLYWGQGITFTNRIHNNGTMAIPSPFWVTYSMSTDAVLGNADDVTLGSYYHQAPVPASGDAPLYSATLSLPAMIPAGYTDGGAVRFFAMADSTLLVPETAESNNSAAVQTSVAASCDLYGVECSVPASVTWGQGFTVQGRVENAGSTNVTGSFTVEFYLSNDSVFAADDVLLGAYTHDADVPANSAGPLFSKSLTLPATIPAGFAASGTYHIGMKTDATYAIAETNEVNNFGKHQLGQDWDSFTAVSPWDLQGATCTVPTSARWGESVYVQSLIRNTGLQPVTQAFTVEYYLSNDSIFGDADDILMGAYLHDADVPATGVGPSFTKQVTFPATIPAGYAASGTVYIGMKTDSANAVAESDEADNFASVGQSVDWAAIAVNAARDLSGYSFNAPDTGRWGDTILVQGRIRNVGPTNVTEDFQVGFYLSNDSVFGDADDVLVGSYQHVADLAGNGIGSQFSLTIPLLAIIPSGHPAIGTEYVGMWVDSGGMVAETNEMNNFGTVGLGQDWDSMAVAMSLNDTTAPTILSWSVNAGASQRSMVKQAGVEFSEPVNLDAGALTVRRYTGTAVPDVTVNVTNPLGDGRTYVLSFSGPGAVGGSLPDGIYDLYVTGAAVHDLAGNAMTGNYALRFHRMFGDNNGDRRVNTLDYTRLRLTLGKSSGDAAFNSALDYDGNGTVSVFDLAQFRRRFGAKYSY